MQESTRNYYNHSAAQYFFLTYQSDISNLWKKLIEQKSEGTILDIGCGSGRDLHYFNQNGFRVVGIDISVNLLKLAHGYSNTPVALADMQFLPFEKSFDAGWAIGSLLHINKADIVKVLSEIYCVLKRNSILVTSVKKGTGSALDNRGRYFTYYQTNEWVNALAQAQFDIVSTEETIEMRDSEKIEWIVTVAKSA